MPSSTPIRRWLLLEQEGNRGDWGNPAGDVIWNADGIRCAQRDATTSSPPEEIRVLFLPNEAAGESRLPPHVNNQGEIQWNVWCHYGGPIGGDEKELATRWTLHQRLSASDKSQLVSGDSPSTVPRHFSKGLLLRWSHELDRLKEIVRKTSALGETPKDFKDCLDALDRAWEAAGAEIGLMKKVAQGKSALTAVLAARFLLDSMPVIPVSSLDALSSALSLCRQSGLLALSPTKEDFSGEVTEAYRRIAGAVLRALNAEKQIMSKLKGSTDRVMILKEAGPVAASHLADLRNHLATFLRHAQWHTEETTAAIKANPRAAV